MWALHSKLLNGACDGGGALAGSLSLSVSRGQEFSPEIRFVVATMRIVKGAPQKRAIVEWFLVLAAIQFEQVYSLCKVSDRPFLVLINVHCSD